MKLSSSHLAWDCYHEFIYTGINSFALFITIVAWGCMWESQRGVWGESIRVRGLSGGGAQREKREKVSTNCEITTDFFPRNSHLSQIKQSKWKYPAANKISRSETPISHPVLYDSDTGAGTSNYNERCHHCKRLITNVSLRKMRGLQDFHSYLYPRLYLWHLRSSLFISVSHTLIHTVHLWTHTQHVS